MPPKKKANKVAADRKVSVVFADDAGPAARRTATPDPDAALAYVLQATAPQAEKIARAKLSEVKASFEPLLQKARKAVEEVAALAKEHGLALRQFQQIPLGDLITRGVGAHRVHDFERHLSDTLHITSNAEPTLNGIERNRVKEPSIAGLTAADLNGPAVATIRRDLGYVIGLPAGLREHIACLYSYTRQFEATLRARRGEAVETLIDIKHPEARFQGPRVETD